MTMKLHLTQDALSGKTSSAAQFVSAFMAEGAPHHMTNVVSLMGLLETADGRDIPFTVDDGDYGHSYVSSPHSAYVLYAEEEMDIVGMTKGRTFAKIALSVLDKILRGARINRAIHIDNWLLSTNLHGNWRGEYLADIRATLTDAYPDHFLILRTLDDWSCPRLMEAARSDNWVFLPARQIWVVEDMEADWWPRNSSQNDRRKLQQSGLTIEDLTEISDTDAERIAELYAMLYIGRYSALNPVFTAAFIQLLLSTGTAEYRVVRDQTGTILAVAGMISRNGIMTPPVVGYDTGRPQSEGLYRIASYLFSERAMDQKLRLHSSAGAADFKRNRGAIPKIEYMAVYSKHLSAPRRLAIDALSKALETWIVPMMQKKGW